MFLVFTSAVDFIAAFCRAKSAGSWRRCTAAMYLSVDRGDAVPQRCTCLWIEATLYRSDVLVCGSRRRCTAAMYLFVLQCGLSGTEQRQQCLHTVFISDAEHGGRCQWRCMIYCWIICSNCCLSCISSS